jgi:hypothetical protein
MWKSRISILVVLLSVAGDIYSQFHIPARFDTVFTEYFRRNSGGWTAGDGTISVPLSDKRVIWLFGDSYIVDVDTTDNTLPCLFQIRNCMMVQDSIDRNAFITYYDSNATGINRTFFKLPENPEFQLIWPDHGYEYQDTVFIFLEHLDNETWELIDIYIAKLLMPDLQIIEMEPLPDMGDYSFGRCVLTDSTAGYRYIYGNKVNWIVWEPFLARCPLDGLFGPWEFWAGDHWTDNITMIQKISDLPVSPSYSVVKIEGRYYIITQENGYLTCGLGREIYSYESNTPEGPFVNKTLLYTEESTINGRYLLTYNGYSHPSFIENGELLISYNVNDWVDTLEPYICPSQCVNVWTDRMDADSYRPKFIRVPLPLITGTNEYQIGISSAQISPNPAGASEIVRLSFPFEQHENLQIFLTDISGRSVRTSWEKPLENPAVIEMMTPENPGIYLIRILAGRKEQCNLKLVVMD